MVTRPVIANTMEIAQLNGCNVVVDLKGAMVCKSAKITVMGFCGEFWSWRTSTQLGKAVFSQAIFGEGNADWEYSQND